ncbi:hypothetical protein F5J12DRAFT_474887 [Pisolithus orientalis]|uniref:uncharacterized protein n=1 Tax=Pisolithus orientalis TaxID=936130 RepID=UPI0022246BDE|nr:uncharacterized protein F5J12DRAFT_474887 [Pisolithus orientalis]KAI5990536.1 hypothetical protein F5J12DRAFT_474887 [Pisolithus orientalis]
MAAAASVSADPQTSLAVAPRSSSSHLNKPARQLVPAFLQKLYEMVNDPADHDLIRWSDTGDSFFVLDQERFSSEVLGRWFKHKNFSSFVRQLNMYGFHKIPHLQQGVLRSENETEFWNFEHPHFIRGQPDMLCLIQRKKQAQSAMNASEDSNAHATSSRDSAGGTVGLSQNQLLDINSIVNGIQAIKRHQAAISADLNELKTSNQHLWQEAMITRERHKKHQDTINRIVKFLAGVFGHAGQMRKNDGGHGGTHAVVPRKPQRLMIGDGKNGKGGVEISDVSEDEGRPTQSPSMSLFGSMDTPKTAPSESFASPRFASIEPSVNDAPTPTDSRSQPRPQQLQTHDSLHTSSNVLPSSNSLTTAAQQQTPQNNNDAIVQAALTQVLNSPSQMQKLLLALQNQSIPNDMFPHQLSPQNQQQLIGPYDGLHFGNGVNAGMDMHTDNHSCTPSFEVTAPTDVPSPFTLSLLGGASDADQLVPFEKHEERLQKTYRTTDEISSDVDELQSNINSFIQTLGIDPTSLDVTNPNHADGVSGNPPDRGGGDGSALGGNDSAVGGNTTGDIDMFAAPDFDFDAFLMDMPRTNDEDTDFDRLAERLDPSVAAAATAREPQSKIAGASSEQLHAFLDEVASQDGGDIVAIPPSIRMPVAVPPHQNPNRTSIHHSPLQIQASPPAPNANIGGPATGPPGAGGRGRKRKSEAADAGDVYDVVPAQPTAVNGPTSAGTNKTKRKR